METPLRYVKLLPLQGARFATSKNPGQMNSSSTHSCIVDITQHALKGQKLLAQGNALGIMSVGNAPCKGKSFKIHLIKKENSLRYVKFLPVVLKLLPLQGARLATHKKTRALPWAKSFCPFRACCLYELLGPFRACGIYLRNLLDHDLIRLAVVLHDVQTLLQTMGATTICVVVFCVGITADGVEVVNGSAAIVLSDAQFRS